MIANLKTEEKKQNNHRNCEKNTKKTVEKYGAKISWLTIFIYLNDGACKAEQGKLTL